MGLKRDCQQSKEKGEIFRASECFCTKLHGGCFPETQVLHLIALAFLLAKHLLKPITCSERIINTQERRKNTFALRPFEGLSKGQDCWKRKHRAIMRALTQMKPTGILIAWFCTPLLPTAAVCTPFKQSIKHFN